MPNEPGRPRACSAPSCASTAPGPACPSLDAVPELDTRGAPTRLWDHLKKGHKQRLYAILSARPDGNLADLDEQVPARLARQTILDRTGAPQLWCILDESVLHRPIGGAKVMRSQLYRLAELAENPRTAIQVVRSSDAHAGLLGGFIIADLDSKPSVAYLETAAEGIVTDSSSALNHVALRSIDSGHRPSRGRRPPDLISWPASDWHLSRRSARRTSRSCCCGCSVNSHPPAAVSPLTNRQKSLSAS
jgi:hypothetical protein